MACNCSDLLDDLELKFDLILELIDTVLTLLAARGAEAPAAGGGGDYYRARQDDYWRRQADLEKLKEEENELIELIQIICMSGVLDG